MRKHTLLAMVVVSAIILAGTWGSMQNVKAVGVSDLFVTAGAAKALGIQTSSAEISSVKGSESSSTPVMEEKTETVDFVITTEKADGSGTGTIEHATKSGEVGGIPYDSLAMANVQEAVNIRSAASEDSEIIGKFYAECGGEIMDTEPGWTMIKTGDLMGWICNDYLLFGDSAVELAEKVVEKEAICTTDCLRVRKTPDPDGTVLSLLANGESINAVETEGDWVKVEFSDGEEGYVSAEYVNISYELGKGETMEAIAAREEAEKAERAAAEAEAKRAQVEAGRTTETTKTNNGAAVALPTELDDVRLLAALIQCEGGGQPYEGQVSIGTVVVNRLRMGRYGNTIYSVIYAKSQFGPAGSGAVARVYAQGPKASCMQAAQDALNGVSYIGAATHFRNIRSGYTGIVIGSHVFW